MVLQGTAQTTRSSLTILEDVERGSMQNRRPMPESGWGIQSHMDLTCKGQIPLQSSAHGVPLHQHSTGVVSSLCACSCQAQEYLASYNQQISHLIKNTTTRRKDRTLAPLTTPTAYVAPRRVTVTEPSPGPAATANSGPQMLLGFAYEEPPVAGMPSASIPPFPPCIVNLQPA